MAAEIQYLSSLDLQYKQDILKTMTRIYYRVSHFETDFLNWLWGIEGPIFSLIDCRKLDYSLLYTLKNYRPHISTFIQGATLFSESRGCYFFEKNIGPSIPQSQFKNSVSMWDTLYHSRRPVARGRLRGLALIEIIWSN